MNLQIIVGYINYLESSAFCVNFGLDNSKGKEKAFAKRPNNKNLILKFSF